MNDHAVLKFNSALHYAIGSATSAQARLEAVISEVCTLGRESFPDDETWAKFQKLLAATTALLPNNPKEGRIRATTSPMTDDEAAKWLREAFDIYLEIAEQLAKEDMACQN